MRTSDDLRQKLRLLCLAQEKRNRKTSLLSLSRPFLHVSDSIFLNSRGGSEEGEALPPAINFRCFHRRSVPSLASSSTSQRTRHISYFGERGRQPEGEVRKVSFHQGRLVTHISSFKKIRTACKSVNKNKVERCNIQQPINLPKSSSEEQHDNMICSHSPAAQHWRFGNRYRILYGSPSFWQKLRGRNRLPATRED